MQKRAPGEPGRRRCASAVFAQTVALVQVEEHEEDEEFSGYGTNGPGAWKR